MKVSTKSPKNQRQTTSDSNSPCPVCGSPCTGVHYGVNTCSSCKGFFHRSLRCYKKYRCRANRRSGFCDYIPSHRASCQYCRFKKCLMAGMSVAAIKDGRYTTIKPDEDPDIMSSLIEEFDAQPSTDCQSKPLKWKHSRPSSISNCGRSETKVAPSSESATSSSSFSPSSSSSFEDVKCPPGNTFQLMETEPESQLHSAAQPLEGTSTFSFRSADVESSASTPSLSPADALVEPEPESEAEAYTMDRKASSSFSYQNKSTKYENNPGFTFTLDEDMDVGSTMTVSYGCYNLFLENLGETTSRFSVPALPSAENDDLLSLYTMPGSEPKTVKDKGGGGNEEELYDQQECMKESSMAVIQRNAYTACMDNSQTPFPAQVRQDPFPAVRPYHKAVDLPVLLSLDPDSPLHDKNDMPYTASLQSDTKTTRKVDRRSLQTLDRTSLQTTAAIPLQTLDRTSLQTTAAMSLQTLDRTSLQTTAAMSLQTLDRTSLQTLDRTSLQTLDRTSLQTLDRTSLQTLDRTSLQTLDRTSLQTLDRTSLQTTAAMPLQTLDRTSLQTTAAMSLQTLDRTSLQTTAPMSLQTLDRTSLLTTAAMSLQTLDRTSLQTTAAMSLQTLDRTSLQTTAAMPMQTLDRASLQIADTLPLQTLGRTSFHITDAIPLQTITKLVDNMLFPVPPPQSAIPRPLSRARPKCLASLYDNLDDVLQNIVQSARIYMTDKLPRSREEIHKQQLKYLETCMQKARTFGPTPMINQEEYDALYAETGIDIDNRRKLTNTFCKRNDQFFRPLVHFARCIPGFKAIQVSEQMELLKWCHFPVVFTTIYQMYDIDIGVGMGLDGHWVHRSNLSRTGRPVFDITAKICDKIQKLEICYEEMCIMKAMLLLCTDHQKPIYSPLADAIYQELFHLLEYVWHQHNHPPERLAQFLDVLKETNNTGDTFIAFVRSCHLYKYASLLKTPYYSALLSKLLPEEVAKKVGPKKDEDILMEIDAGGSF